MPTVFLSSAHEDAPVARNLTRALRADGIGTFNAEDVPPGANFFKVLNDGLEASDAFIFLISRNFLGSEWGRIEIAAAMAELTTGHAKQIYPVLIDPDLDPSTDVPSLLRRYQWLDLRRGVSENSFESLIESLKSTDETPDLGEQLDAEESLLSVRRRELDRERWDELLLMELAIRARTAQILMTVTAVIGILLAVAFSTIPFVSVVRDSEKFTSSAALLIAAGAFVGAATTAFGKSVFAKLAGRRHDGRPD